jgi:hypothetical protein
LLDIVNSLSSKEVRVMLKNRGGFTGNYEDPVEPSINSGKMYRGYCPYQGVRKTSNNGGLV